MQCNSCSASIQLTFSWSWISRGVKIPSNHRSKHSMVEMEMFVKGNNRSAKSHNWWYGVIIGGMEISTIRESCRQSLVVDKCPTW
jgi:hypothetical protein